MHTVNISISKNAEAVGGQLGKKRVADVLTANGGILKHWLNGAKY